MKITHFNNSFISVGAQGERIICDPWIGKANASGWQSFPEFSNAALRKQLVDARWIYISHLHDDHFHTDTLKLCDLLNREFIIKRFESPVLRERLKRLGVTRIHEIEPFTVQKFGPFELSIFPQMTSNSSGLNDDVNYDLDTSIAIKAEGSVFFNQVDNPLSLHDITHIHSYINDNLGAIDVACLMSGAASEYPHLFLGIDQTSEKRRIVERSLFDLCAWLRLLSPRYFFPAGGTYLIPGWMGTFNDNIAQPNFVEISSHIAASDLPIQALHLEGGRFIELSAEQKIAQTGIDLPSLQANRQKAIEMHKQDNFQYEAFVVPAWPTFISLLDTARKNWTNRVSKGGLKIHQAIQFNIYSQLRLDGDRPDASQHLENYQICQATETDAGVLVIHIDQRALFGCLTRNLIWNGVLGALCLFERRPNQHYPTDFFSLNFLTLTNEQIQSFDLEV